MAERPLLVRGGTVLSGSGAAQADVRIQGELIAEVGPDLDPTGCEVVDAAGAYVMAGAIDAHTHLDLPVGAVRSADDFESGTVAAACGGTTTLIDFAGAGREPWAEALTRWHAKADGRAVIDYGFHLTVTELPPTEEGSARRFRQYAERGVTSVKLYMAYPERLMVDDDVLRRALVASTRTGVLVMVHAESGDDVVRGQRAALAAGRTGPEAHPGSRPPWVEAKAVRRAAELALAAGARVYVVHLSSAEALLAVVSARSHGARVVAETCPQYLFLDASSLADPEHGQDFVCAPPVRSAEDREALWDGLASSLIEIVSTDHCPFTAADRRRGTAGGEAWSDFTQIPGGLPGLETRLALVYQGVRQGRISLGRWVDAVAEAPARRFGLAGRKGFLVPGHDADVVVFDPAATRTLDAGGLHSRSDHSPYAGLTVTGWPAVTISRGRVLARGGEPYQAVPGRGRYLARTPALT